MKEILSTILSKNKKKMINSSESINQTIDGIERFIRDEITRTGLKGAIIGLSGGIDSAVVAYLTVRAIGKEEVTLLHMPESELSSNHTEDAKIIANDLGIELETINITSFVTEAMKILPKISGNKLAKGNLKARIRAVFWYSIANLENKMVIGASNKSELLIGYGTKFGDLAADLWPIGDIYKTELFKIADRLGINEKIRLKLPTAGLWVNQTDEEEIGVSYSKLDRFLAGLEEGIEEMKLKEDIELSDFQFNRIKNLVRTNKHKSMMPKIYKPNRI